MLADLYSDRGRPPRNPLCMLRSCLLSLKRRVSPITRQARHCISFLRRLSSADSIRMTYPVSGHSTTSSGACTRSRTKPCGPGFRPRKKQELHSRPTKEKTRIHREGTMRRPVRTNDPQDMLFPALPTALHKTGFLQHLVDLAVIRRMLPCQQPETEPQSIRLEWERCKTTCDCKARDITDCSWNYEYSRPDTDWAGIPTAIASASVAISMLSRMPASVTTAFVCTAASGVPVRFESTHPHSGKHGLFSGSQWDGTSDRHNSARFGA